MIGSGWQVLLGRLKRVRFSSETTTGSRSVSTVHTVQHTVTNGTMMLVKGHTSELRADLVSETSDQKVHESDGSSIGI